MVIFDFKTFIYSIKLIIYYEKKNRKEKNRYINIC